MDTIKRLLKAMDERDKRTPKPYDTQATVARIEDGKAYVVLPGQTEETEVKLTIGCKVGDTVQVRVADHKAFLVGNGTAPPTDDTYARQVNKTLTEKVESTNMVIRTVQRAVNAVRKIAANTNQYFWHTETGEDTGAHITEIPQDEFLADPENGGGNLLARSNGVAVRDGLTELAQFRADGMAFNDSAGNKVVDVDTGGGLETRGFSKRLFVGTSLYPGTPVSVAIDHPYFSSETATGGYFYGIISNGDIAHTYINDLTQDFTTTSHDTIINYSAADEQFTLTYTGSNERVVVIRLVFVWEEQVPKTSFSFGWRWKGSVAGIFSTIIGEGLIAQRAAQTVIGRYNDNNTSNVFEVGIGADDTARKNGLEVTQDGDVLAPNGHFKSDTDKTVNPSIITTESGITCNLARFTRAGNLATLYARFQSTAAKSGTWTVGTLLEGYRPVDEVGFITATAASIGYINAAGVITYIGSLGANSNGYIKATYMVE